jgi:hypothetical protein
MNSENSPKGEAFRAARFRTAPANVASRRTPRSDCASVTVKAWGEACPACVAPKSRITGHESRHFYSTMPPSRNRRNPRKTNNRCTLYSTINRGGPQQEFVHVRKSLVTNHESQITQTKQDTVSSHFPRNSNKTNDRRPNQAGHFFDDPTNIGLLGRRLVEPGRSVVIPCESAFKDKLRDEVPSVAQTLMSVLLRATGNNAQPQSRANHGGLNREWYAFPVFTNPAKRSDTTCQVPFGLSPTKQRFGTLAK